MDYSKTLNLPKTDFPMRANLPAREPEMQKQWEEKDIYGELRKQRKGKEKFILHDGPPFANGNIHLGTTLNKILKDIVVRFASMKGYDAPYVPGWDTHGLPIEVKAISELGLNRKEVGPIELRNKCKEFALHYKDVQKEEFKRLGVMGDWENPYLTLNPEYEAIQIKVFGDMAKKGYIYKSLYPVYWCPTCETALAEAEIEFKEKTSDSVYVRFEIKDGLGKLPLDSAIVIWTTTPWTLPANMGISIHPEYDYVLLDTDKGKLLLAEGLEEKALAAMGVRKNNTLAKFKGIDLEGVVCQHPFFERDSLVMVGDHVTLEEGTGCVHTAPAHGQEDFDISKKYGLSIITPLDYKGHFTGEAEFLEGIYYQKANRVLIDRMSESGHLLQHSTIKHQYAHCWRCQSPIVWRATEQWFASIDGFRKEALEGIEKVRFIPEWGKERIHNMVADRSDWCISRQRVWGVPIPIFYCTSCNEHIINDETINAVSDLFAKEGSNAWFTHEAEEILPEGFICPHCGHDHFRKETDIMDVWFDSGSSHAAVLRQREELAYPADMYLEGSDQHRGWFNSSLSTSVATEGVPPYKSVLTHGFVVDGDGRKMSKSLGNVIYPQEIIDKYGADVLRLWVTSADYRGDIRVSMDILQQMAEVYRKIRNTFRFMLGNLDNFDPDTHMVAVEELTDLDRWALEKTNQLVKKVKSSYEDYAYHQIYHAVHNFCVLDMSNFYFEIIKDRMYTEAETSKLRRGTQTVLYQIALDLVKLVAPIIPYTADEVWQYLPKATDMAESVHLTVMPGDKDPVMNTEEIENWQQLRKIRFDVAKALEEARTQKMIGKSLEASLELYVTEDQSKLLEGFATPLADLFLVSKINVIEGSVPDMAFQGEVAGLGVLVKKAEGEKCARCWHYDETVGENQEEPELCDRCYSIVK